MASPARSTGASCTTRAFAAHSHCLTTSSWPVPLGHTVTTTADGDVAQKRSAAAAVNIFLRFHTQSHTLELIRHTVTEVRPNVAVVAARGAGCGALVRVAGGGCHLLLQSLGSPLLLTYNAGRQGRAASSKPREAIGVRFRP